MAEPTGSATSSTEVIPAGHAAPSADEEVQVATPRTGLAGLSIAALGV